MAVIKPTADPHCYQIGEGRACLLPHRMNDRVVAGARPLPGVVILVHGVNDLGVSYPAQEAGLCRGLNERLSRSDLEPAGYRLPSNDRHDALEADPDAVYYRCDGKGYGPVIPFYWGYREVEDAVKKDTPHGQYLDRHGNRLDKNGAQGGGPFANATSNLPDMWGAGFRPYGGALNAMAGDPTHPLRGAPDRRYMVLAALRLAALAQAVRHYDENETVTLIGHSQGCLLSLLAQAFLDEWQERPADCLILNHPPYGLDEPVAERLQSGCTQQSTHARLSTLQNLVRLVTAAPHAAPALAALVDAQCGHVCGPFWTPSEAKRPDPARPGGTHRQGITFAERDNRGKVYLYFCPEDLTVGLDSVLGIGSFGVPEQMSGTGARGERQRFAALESLGPRFLQRVFSMRERNGARPVVGAPPGDYCLRQPGEDFHAHAPTPAAADLRHAPSAGETRRISGEELTPPCRPDLRYGEVAAGRQAVDPIDAATAITNDGIGQRRETIDDPRPAGSVSQIGLAGGEGLDDPAVYQVEQALNRDKAVEDRCRVESAYRLHDGRLSVLRSETPNEARLRWQSTKSMANSYHSAIVANPEHSRLVHAYDVAIAQGESVSNPTFRELLLRLADWRVVTKKDPMDPKSGILLKDVKANAFYKELPERMKTFVEANARYYTEGTLPLHLIPAEPPKAVVSDTLRDAHNRGTGWGNRR
ncbi:MAG: DUF3274 domain-containing protein [Propionivibrio sp.]